MPTEVRCKECGYLLASWPELPGDGWYAELRIKYNGKCPKCGHLLPKYTDNAIRTMEVKIIPIKRKSKV